MDNAGDWLYIVFLIIAGISSLFGSKNKKKRPKQILGQPDREIVTNEDNVPDKGFWEILEEMQNPKPAKQPVPTPKRKKKQQEQRSHKERSKLMMRSLKKSKKEVWQKEMS